LSEEKKHAASARTDRHTSRDRKSREKGRLETDPFFPFNKREI